MLTRSSFWISIGRFIRLVKENSILLIVFLVGGGFIGKLLGSKIPFMNNIPTWINIVIGSVICGAVFLLIIILITRKIEKTDKEAAQGD